MGARVQTSANDRQCHPCWLPTVHTIAEHEALEADVTVDDLAEYGLSTRR